MRPRFEADTQSVRVQTPLPATTDVYGLGMAAGSLRRNGRGLLLWNTDAWCYGEQTPALYQSHPWFLALLPDGSTLGVLAESPQRGLVQVAEDGVEWAFDGEPYDLHYIEGVSPEQVLGALVAMIGMIEMPPVWALGYHQCRWSYADEAELQRIASEFRQRKIPCDALWFDIDHMQAFRTFSWDSQAFPDPKRLTGELREQGFHSVAILDPGIVADASDPHCAEGLEQGHFVTDATGKPASGHVWPGLCHFPDFTSRKTRDWWAEHVRRHVLASDLDGLWNDMNEPSVFRVPSRTLPDDARHAGDEHNAAGEHARFHNLYGQLMAQASRAGLRAARPERRPFVLTRASHLAGASQAATWTGDNQARWEDLAWVIPMVLSLGLSGQPFAGPDLGGFHGDPDEELFVRWFELGAWLPFARGHGAKHSCRKEPWAFGPAAEAPIRRALEQRMRLLPTLRTLFEKASRDGTPVMRPLFMADPSDLRLRRVDDAFLLGPDLLIAPVVERGARQKRVVLPKHPGGWFAFPEAGPRRERAVFRAPAPLGSTPVFARAGSIIVEGPTRQHVGEPDDQRTFHAFLDHEGQASGHSYEDDDRATWSGESVHRRERFAVRVERGGITWSHESSGSFVPLERRCSLKLHGRRQATRMRSFEVPLDGVAVL